MSWIAQKARQYQAEIFNTFVAHRQRGLPESLMQDAQLIAGGGPISFVIEHVGDLTHRMSERRTFAYAGYDDVKDKVEKTLRKLTDREGFNQLFIRNIANNAKYNKMYYVDLREEVRKALEKYADAHEKIPVFNYVQNLARSAAVALGRLDFEVCVDYLLELKYHLDQGEEHWISLAHRFSGSLLEKEQVEEVTKFIHWIVRRDENNLNSDGPSKARVQDFLNRLRRK